MAKKVKRLFEGFKPEHYKIHLTPNKSNMIFTGEVTIYGQKTGRPSKRLTFHQKDLKITKAEVTYEKRGQSDTKKIDRINNHNKLYEVRLHSKELLYPGKYKVTLHFSGKITDVMLGLYPSYFTHDNKQKIILGTQFESHHAREVLPCIDEPEAKAIFELSVTAPSTEEVLSNTLPAQTKITGKTKTVTFKPTPVMSIYLLAFVMGELHSQEAKTKDGVLVRAWSSVAHHKDQLKYAVTESVRLLEFYTNYFGISYPLEKCDQVALPDFDAGAMENWGLCTYREIALLADPHNRSISNEQFVSMVIAHELSHQWFGDLVTMKWWDDLWLNESFAALMEHLSLDRIHPEWQQWELYASTDIVSTSTRDSYSGVQAVVVDVTDPDLIESLFDPSIVYAKGARLIKMMFEYIGEDAFRAGLNAYFKKFAYKNATRHDFWQCFSEHTHKDVESLLDPWLTQAGMPVLDVKQTNDQLELSQKRFLLDAQPDNRTWPITLLASTKTTPEIFDEVNGKVMLDSKQPTLVNVFGSGHFIVNYMTDTQKQFVADSVTNLTIPAEARINILNDSLLLAKKGTNNLTVSLDLIKNSKNEPRDSVWALISRIIGTAAQLTEGDATSEKQLRQLRKSLASEHFKRLGWEDSKTDDSNTIQLRHTMIAYMAISEDPQVIGKLTGYYQAHDDITRIPAEIRSTVFGCVMKNSSDYETIASKLLDLYPTSSPEVQLDITSALASTKDPLLSAKILTSALGKSGFVKPQDVMRWVALFMRNHYLRDEAWNYIENNWQWLQDVMGDSKSFDYLPIYLAGVISTDAGIKRYQEFFATKRHLKALLQNIDIGLEDAKTRTAWRKRDEAKIKNWLKQNVS